jgi:hypothetical protein
MSRGAGDVALTIKAPIPSSLPDLIEMARGQ